MAKAGGLDKFLRDEKGEIVAVLHDVLADGRPRYVENCNERAAISINTHIVRENAEFLNVEGYLNGRGVRIGVWEVNGGVSNGHPEWEDRMSVDDSSATSGSLHAAHVIGTLIAAGFDPEARGMAPQAQVGLWDIDDDVADMLTRGSGSADAVTLLVGSSYPISNHSYSSIRGYRLRDRSWTWWGPADLSEDPGFGLYEDRTRDIDLAVEMNPYYLPFFAASNNRNDTPPIGTEVRNRAESEDFIFNGVPAGDGDKDDGFDSLSSESSAKNVLTVGATNDAVIFDTTRFTLFVETTEFSGWGPTDDGRIKPDIVANGHEVKSTTNRWDGETGERIDSYEEQSGTSMATPSACGSAALLVDLFEEYFEDDAMKGATLKGLMIHTADDLGIPGPDYQFGWGLMNTRAAAQVIKDHAGIPENGHLIEARKNADSSLPDILDFFWDEENPIRLTLCYADPAGVQRSGLDDPTLVLVNDLDLRLIAPNGEIHRPYRMNPSSPADPATYGDNDRDNVEQIFVKNPQVGRYRLEVSVEGRLQNDRDQDYSLILTGNRATAPKATAVSVTSDSPASFDFGGAISPEFTNRLPTAATGWEHFNHGTGQFTIIGGALRFDSRIINSETSLNTSTLLVDVPSALVADVMLRFRWRESSDESNPIAAGAGAGEGDGVSVSRDGINFYPIYDLTGGSMTWENVSLNLGDAAATQGLLVGGRLWIRFSQVDTHPWPSNGIEIDNVEVFVSQPGFFRLNNRSLEVEENAGSIEVLVRRSFGSEGNASVRLSTIPGSARPGIDYEDLDTVINFADEESEVSQNISILNNETFDGQRSFELLLSDPTGGAGLLSPSLGTVLIIDDDTMPEIEVDLRFDGVVNATPRGANAPSKTFRIRNSQGGTLNYSLGGFPSWVALSTTSGSSVSEWDEVELTFDTSRLPVGRYRGELTISDPAAENSPFVVPMDLLIGYQTGPFEFSSLRDWNRIPQSAADPRATIYPSVIEVRSRPGRIYRVAAAVNDLETQEIGNLDVLLHSPEGAAVMLFSDILESSPQKNLVAFPFLLAGRSAIPACRGDSQFWCLSSHKLRGSR